MGWYSGSHRLCRTHLTFSTFLASHLMKLNSLLLILFVTGQLPVAADITHGFLATGSHTYIVNGAGEKIWTYPGGSRDGFVLSNGNVVLTVNKGKKYPGGAVLEINRTSGEEKLIWKGTQSEVNSAQPTTDGTYVLSEAGAKPRLLEVDGDGKVIVEFPLQCQSGNHHMETRMARKLDDGTYLAPHLLDFAVKHYDRSGKLLGEMDTTVEGDPERKIHSWPFTAIRQSNGHTLVCCTNGNRVVEFDAAGKVAWQLTNDDLPGPWLQDPCGGQVLPNGNIVITSYAGGRKDVNAPKLIEVNRDKKVVWTYSDGEKHGIHHFQILTPDGKALSGQQLK